VETEVVAIPPPTMLRVVPRSEALLPESPAKVILSLASSVLATQPVQVSSEAVMVPVPVKEREAPVPTTIAAEVLVPEVMSVKVILLAVTPVKLLPSPYR